jgi:hypothetical protein
MPTNITNVYPVQTAPLIPEKFQGMIISLMNRQYRFCAFEPMTGTTPVEAGVFVTGAVDVLGNTIVTKPIVAGAKILGVTLLNFQRILTWDVAQNCFLYPPNTIVSLLEEGDTVMYAETAVDVADPVYFRVSANAALTRIGAVTNATGVGLDLSPRAKFLEKTSAPGLVRVSIADII